MSFSRRDLFRQIPTKNPLRALGALVGGGLGSLTKPDPNAPGAVEEAGLALGRRAASRQAPSWTDMLNRLVENDPASADRPANPPGETS